MMPPEQMLPEIVELWMEQTSSQEIAERAAFNLYQHLEYAPVLAFEATDSIEYSANISRILGSIQYTQTTGADAVPEQTEEESETE